MNIKNDLRDTTILFMKACLKVMSEDPIKIVAFEKIMIDGDEYRIETEGRPNYLSAYVAHQNEIETLPETRNLTRLMKEIESVKNAIEIDTDNRELALGVNAWMWLNFRYFHHLLTLYFNAGGTTSFSKDAFDSSYEELDRHVFGSTTIIVRGIAFLDNITTHASCELAKDVTIRKATEAEKKRYALFTLAFRNSTSHIPAHVLEVRLDIKRDGAITEKEKKFLDSTIETLDLATSLILGTRTVSTLKFWRCEEESFWQGNHSSFATGFPNFVPKYLRVAAKQIDGEVAAILAEQWENITRALRDHPLETPITRLLDSCTRTKSEDRIIDYWLALESLYLPVGSKEELTQSVVLSISYYLGKNSKDRAGIRDNMLKSYKWRSYIIHGKRESNAPKLSLDDICSKTFEVLQKSLIKRISE